MLQRPVGGELLIRGNWPSRYGLANDHGRGRVRFMRDMAILTIHLITIFVKMLRPGGVRAVAAESLLMKQQLLIVNRPRHRAPNLTALDRILLALTTLFVNPRRIPQLAVVLKPATLLKFHKALVDRKYRRLFSCAQRRQPGPKGPAAELIAAIVEMKCRNPKLAMCASRNRFLMPSALISTKMWFAVSSRSTIAPTHQERMARHG